MIHSDLIEIRKFAILEAGRQNNSYPYDYYFKMASDIEKFVLSGKTPEERKVEEGD